MSLKFNAAEARKADFSSVIRDTGKYVGVITRAEKLKSDKGTLGLGLSFKSDDGATANYLDIYTTRADGSELWGANLVQSILCCARVKDADEGDITFNEWNKSEKAEVPVTTTGYPALMGKRIGLVLQKEMQTHSVTGADVERVSVVRVFEASSGLTASEILDGKTKPEKIDQLLKTLPPVRDTRKKAAQKLQTLADRGIGGTNEADPFNDDINF